MIRKKIKKLPYRWQKRVFWSISKLICLWQLKTIQHRGLPLTHNTTTDWAIQNNNLSLKMYGLRLLLPIPEGTQAVTGLIPAMFTNHSVKNSVIRISCGSFQSSLNWTLFSYLYQLSDDLFRMYFYIRFLVFCHLDSNFLLTAWFSTPSGFRILG